MVKNLLANAGDVLSSPGSGRSPEAGNSNPLQYSRLGNPMDRGAWRATAHGVNLATKQQCAHMHTHTCVKVKALVAQSCPTLCDPVEAARQAPLSMGFSRQESPSSTLLTKVSVSWISVDSRHRGGLSSLELTRLAWMKLYAL